MFNSVVVIRPGVKRVTLSRLIVSRIFHGRKISLEEVHVLFQNQLWLEQKCLTDETFSKKYSASIAVLSSVLKECNFSRGFTEGTLLTMRGKVRSLLEEFTFPARNLGSVETKLANSFYSRPYTSAGTPTNRLPAKKVIGKGYGDHGTAKNPALDGSPSWQEVATTVSRLENQRKDLEEQAKLLRSDSRPGARGALSDVETDIFTIDRQLEKLKTSRRNPANAKAPKRP